MDLEHSRATVGRGDFVIPRRGGASASWVDANGLAQREPEALEVPALDLARIQRGVQRGAGVEHYVGTHDARLARQRIDLGEERERERERSEGEKREGEKREGRDK